MFQTVRSYRPTMWSAETERANVFPLETRMAITVCVKYESDDMKGAVQACRKTCLCRRELWLSRLCPSLDLLQKPPSRFGYIGGVLHFRSRSHIEAGGFLIRKKLVYRRLLARRSGVPSQYLQTCWSTTMRFCSY
jgi:hypothetical protein